MAAIWREQGRIEMSERLILVLDEGTTSTRAMLLTPAGELRGTAQR